VIDDGRRFLERTSQQYDVINIDPPPPVQAAGSSLLYSKEFYATVRQRLRPGGIQQQWLPTDDKKDDDVIIRASVARALAESFPYVRVFHAADVPGLLFLATSYPLETPPVTDLVRRMPPTAIQDLLEWGPESTPEKELSDILETELPIDQVITAAPEVPALEDDRPVNEYYALRRLRLSKPWRRVINRWHVSPHSLKPMPSDNRTPSG